jgi:hypothetical protein
MKKMEETMFKFRLGAGVAATITVVLGMSGCGGSAEPQKPENATSIDPFGVGEVDLRAGASDNNDDDDVDMTDLQVPGSEYGLKKGGGTAKTKCPKGKAGKKCRAAAKKASGPIPESSEIAGQMEGIPWGLHYRGVMKNFEQRIRKEYEDELKNARGAVEEYDVRTKMMREIQKLKKSYVEFNGQTTGYEGAVLEGEFTHNNGESMLEWDAGKFVEYMFFFKGRFWKRLRTFRKEALNIPDFETYVGTLDAKFGQGKRIYDSSGALAEVRWQNGDTYMTAKDKTSFYGVFCLYFTARVSEDNLSALRPNADKGDGRVDEHVSEMVQSVTSGDIADHNSSVLDNYTGQDTGGKGVTIDADHSVMGKKKKGKGGGSSESGGGGDDLF